MYQRHFGLGGEPFSIAPDPRLLYMSERHREALAHLLYGVRGGGGFVLLTGDVGTGKTTVCRCLLEQVPAHCHVAYIFNPALDELELLRTVCAEFHVPVPAALPGGAPTRKDCVDALNAHLLRAHAAGQNSLLIIDEAQNLSPAVLEQLRLLTNLETNERKLLQIVLIGQPELQRLLARPELEQLSQRVIARYHLQPLGADEVGHYVAHRLQACGLQGPLPFDRAALRRIARLSRGIPRRINLLCDRALLGAYALGRTRVDRRIVDRAATEVFGPGGDGTPVRRSAGWMAAGASAAAAVAGGFGWVVWSSPAGVADRPIVASAVAPMAATPAGVASAPTPTSAVSAAVAGSAASAPPVTAAALAAEPAEAGPVASAVSVEATIDALRAALATPAANDAGAWQSLAARWRVTLDGGDACANAATQQLQCHRGADVSVTLLRRLDRPAIVALRDEGGPVHAALLTSLDERQATLQLGASTFTVPVPVLAGLWEGQFATLWRAPPGYRGGALNPANALVADWLARQLDRAGVDGGGAGRAVRERLQAFQRAQGLADDGLAGPLTLMQLNRAIGVDEPRLDP